MSLSERVFLLFLLAFGNLPFTCARDGTRKSLSFKQALPTADFITDPPAISAHVPLDADPHDVARLFIEEHVAGATHGYYIRNDSYTDQITGISHVYARQLLHGLEIIDGDVNLNIRDGKVLSYGNSFFNGGLPWSIQSPTYNLERYCWEIPSKTDPFACEVSLDRMRTATSIYPSSTREHENSPVPAAFFFTLAVYPEVLRRDTYLQSAYTAAGPEPCPDPFEDTFNSECWSIYVLPGVIAPVKARKVYVQTWVFGWENTKLSLAWRLEVTLEDNYYEAYVYERHPASIIAVIDWVSDGPAPKPSRPSKSPQDKVTSRSPLVSKEYITSDTIYPSQEYYRTMLPSPEGTYRVWEWGINDPASGNRTLKVAPYNTAASPLGWHSVHTDSQPVDGRLDWNPNPTTDFTTTTIGNNVIAQADWKGNKSVDSGNRPDGGEGLLFDFPWNEDTQNSEPRRYVKASVTQMFYMANMYHDLLYLYGFDENAGNFQQFNFGKGGKEGDRVILDVQDESRPNGATFLAPPDGQNGHCRMSIWDAGGSPRDAGLDAGILIHELSHGLSSRLTGGPRNAGCLVGDESRGMGEGWGDFIATLVRSTRIHQDYPIGAWAANRTDGIRRFPYSIDSNVNPTMYNFLQKEGYLEKHMIGEVWAEILWVVSNGLIEKYGFADSLFPTSESEFYRTRQDNIKQLIPRAGNTLMLQLLINGMKIQPCRPTFLQARNAIIAADQYLTGGENECLLWEDFASRGMGFNAKRMDSKTGVNINGFKVPAKCM